jgi:hypothetical protein
VPVINLTVLQDVLGSTEPVDAVITATVNRASVDAYRIDNQFIIFPRDIKINVVEGEPEVPFVLTVLPASYYWHIDIFVAGEAPVRRSVIVPGNAGPYDFDELIDVVPETALPDAGTDAATAYAALIESYAIRAEEAAASAVEGGGGVPSGGDTGQVLAKASDTNFDVEWVDQTGGSGSDTADFQFSLVEEEEYTESIMTIANHDMYITTTRTDEGMDADIAIEAADDVFIRANGDDVSITAFDEIRLNTGENENAWTFRSSGAIEFPDGSVQETAYIFDGQIIPLPDFLDYEEGRTALPTLNENFGWNSQGMWFGPTDMVQEQADNSYPIFSSFTLSETDRVELSFDVDIQEFCSDAGVCVYLDGTTPKWSWDPDETRIAAQFNCPNPVILGIEGTADSQESEGVPDAGVYRIVFIYDPSAETEKVIFEYYVEGNNNALSRITLNEALPSGDYRIGFASDNDRQDEGPFEDSLVNRTYISNLEILINYGDIVHSDSLQDGSSGETTSGTGDITFDGVKIIGAGTASGDGNGYGTIELVPDEGRYSSDQYLIIDPTVPNHIHIRAGGEQDSSNAELIIGAENTNVVVSDNGGTVSINSSSSQELEILNEATEPSLGVVTYNLGTLPSIGDTVTVNDSEYTVTEIDYSTEVEGQQIIYCDDVIFEPQTTFIFVGQPVSSDWVFSSDGSLNLSRSGIIANNSGDIVLDADDDVYLRSSESEDNRVATLGDIGVETDFVVAGGADGTQPTFDGDPLFSGSYVRMSSNLVHFQIQVDFDNITSFGDGQYYVDLPFPAKHSYIFRDACLHDVSNPRQYQLSGHVLAGESRMTLWYPGAGTQDQPFDYNSPALLTVNDSFHIAGTYIANTEAP